MTAGVIQSSTLIFFVGSTPVALTCQTDATFSISNATRTTSCKGSGQFTEELYGQTSWEGSGTAWASYDGTLSVSDLTGLILARTISPLVYGTGVSGDDKLSGNVIWTKLDILSPGTNENVQISYAFKGTGTLTQATYA